MKPRHAAALALVDWYLMQPPMLSSGGEDHSASLTKWAIIGSFDSAKECEAYRDRHISAFLPFIHEDGKREVLLDSACIATNDLRLAK
jgi:hypothetical protein